MNHMITLESLESSFFFTYILPPILLILENLILSEYILKSDYTDTEKNARGY